MLLEVYVYVLTIIKIMKTDIENCAKGEKEFMQELSIQLKTGDDQVATNRILRAVLHSLRECITRSESLELMLRMPDWLKNIYQENWVYDDSREIVYHIGDFRKKVLEIQDEWEEHDIGKKLKFETMKKGTFNTIHKFISNNQDDTINSAFIIGFCME